jgi:hypothetical protein
LLKGCFIGCTRICLGYYDANPSLPLEETLDPRIPYNVGLGVFGEAQHPRVETLGCNGEA